MSKNSEKVRFYEPFCEDLEKTISAMLSEKDHDWRWLENELKIIFLQRCKDQGVDSSCYEPWIDSHPLRERVRTGHFGVGVLVDIAQCLGVKLNAHLLFGPKQSS